MANYNFGINCETVDDAEKLYQYLANLNIYKDGLDISEDRVMLTSSQALKDEIIKYANINLGKIIIEIWPENVEYDDAEENGKIEFYECQRAKLKKPKEETLSVYKSFSGSGEKIDSFKKWLLDQKYDGFNIINTWVPEVEYGSYGLEFSVKEPKLDKLLKKEWMSKGVVIEKRKS